MARFKFRLQKVLEYRSALETEAKGIYLAKRSEVLAAEAVINGIKRRRLEALSEPRSTLEHFRALEAQLQRLDDEEREQTIVLNVLNDEAEGLRIVWIRHKQDLETIEKLREKAHEAWTQEANRREQAELDEWTVLRRAA